ncbi:MAG TPA: nitroreductase [Thermohalobaculum sp.]|nr:nitroreductase [Thermohalobaculum sp.]
MPDPRPEVLDFLLSRRSRPAKTLGEPGPDRDGLMRLLTAAARIPDHKKLEPWRFVVIEGAARDRLAAAAATRLGEIGETRLDKYAEQFRQGAVIVAVVSRPVPHPDVPEWEQQYSAACVCMTLLTAALAAGWGAQWLTGPLVRDARFLGEALGCTGGETVAGFVHIGTERVAPSERDRPDVAAITTWA